MNLSRQDVIVLGDEVETRLRKIMGVNGADELVTNFAVQHLRERGYNVADSHYKWESLKEFMARLGIERHASVHRDIQHWKERGNTVITHHAPTGKLMEILSNKDFDAFATRHKKPEPEQKR